MSYKPVSLHSPPLCSRVEYNGLWSETIQPTQWYKKTRDVANDYSKRYQVFHKVVKQHIYSIVGSLMIDYALKIGVDSSGERIR